MSHLSSHVYSSSLTLKDQEEQIEKIKDDFSHKNIVHKEKGIIWLCGKTY